MDTPRIDYELSEAVTADVILNYGNDIDDVPTSVLARLIDTVEAGSSVHEALETEYASRQG